jgi:recombination protein RecT
MANTLQTSKPKFSVYMTSEAVKKRINEIIGAEKGQDFITSIISAVNTNPQLGNCDNATIISAALVGQSLGLSPSPFMGQFYFVPFNDRKNDRVVATFQIGYKGYIAMAMKSGVYRDLDVLEIRQGELIGRDKETGKYLFKFIEDENERVKAPVIGYMAYFELLNGFRKSIYWSKEKMEKHAEEYSQGYRSDKKNGTAYTFWSKDFNAMAFKTMLRQLISKWGIMSTTLEKAYVNDMSVVKEDGTNEYVDNVDFDSDGVVVEDTPKQEEKPVEKKTVKTVSEDPASFIKKVEKPKQDPGEVEDIFAALLNQEE